MARLSNIRSEVNLRMGAAFLAKNSAFYRAPTFIIHGWPKAQDNY